MAHWTSTLDSAWYSRRLSGSTPEYVQWEPPQGSRPAITGGLLIDSAHLRLLSRLALDNSTTPPRLVLHLTASQTGGIIGGSQDLSTTFEGDPHIRVVARGLTWDLPDGVATDDAEHYIYEIPAGTQAPTPRSIFEDFVEGVAVDATAQEGVLTLWDGAGTNPFTPADTTAPTFSSAETSVDGSEVVITFDEALDEAEVPAASAFDVQVAGSARGVTGVAISGDEVTLTLASAVAAGEAVTVAYTAPA